MKTIIENVINSQQYELNAMLKKIDTMWLQGGISDDERTELISLAREKATPDMGYATIEQRIFSIEQRLAALENAGQFATPEEYPEWRQPTGAHDAYHAGDKITYKNKRYICIAPEGYTVAYPPDVLPNMWKIVND